MMDPGHAPQKRLCIGHVFERGGINAVRTLERHGLVVAAVDGRADYGRDLNGDITSASRITGGIIGVQVKGGASFRRGERWVIPASETSERTTPRKGSLRPDSVRAKPLCGESTAEPSRSPRSGCGI